MVTIKSTYTVIPSEPTPKGPFWLSENDQINPWSHAPSIYVYRPKSNDNVVVTDNAVERMKDSLSRILVHYYPLAGRLRWIAGRRIKLNCNELGVTLMEAETAESLDDYGDFGPGEAIRELIPKVDVYNNPIEDVPLLLVQLTRFSCGGLSVGIVISHMVVDGASAIHFINSWAKLTRGGKLDKDEMPFLDRTVLKSREPLRPPRFEHPEFKPLPLILGKSNNMEERKKETTMALLKLSKDEVEKLKKNANEFMNEQKMLHQRPFSRFEAIAGHIWKTLCKARQGDYNQPTVARFVGDIRNRLKPPLPRNYFGNALSRTVTPICLGGDIVTKPLFYASQKIREAADALNDEYVRSALDLLTSQENVEGLRASFHTVGCVKGEFFGNPNVSIVSWMSLAVYGADFGWGKPAYMGPGVVNADGKIFIVPGSDGDGSFILAVRLQTPHTEAFKRFFYKDI